MGVVCQIRRYRKHHIAPEKTVLQNFRNKSRMEQTVETSSALQLEPRQKWAVDPKHASGTRGETLENMWMSGLGCQGPEAIGSQQIFVGFLHAGGYEINTIYYDN